MMKHTSKFILMVWAIFALNFAYAEQSETFGDYTVHYIAVNSTFLDPDIASQYNILRGDRRAFINISVLKNSPDGSTTAVTSNLSGTKRNLLGQSQELNFVEIIEGDAIYYIAQFEFSNAEDARFEVLLQPEHQGRNHSLEWASKLYNN